MKMTKPVRIRLSRKKGWRMPANAVKVDRTTRWGNPFVVGRVACDGSHAKSECDCQSYYGCEDAAGAVEKFREWRREIAATHRHVGSDFVRRWLAPLRGKNLACWCPLCAKHGDGKQIGEVCPDCAPCHADVLLELANGPQAEPP